MITILVLTIGANLLVIRHGILIVIWLIRLDLHALRIIVLLLVRHHAILLHLMHHVLLLLLHGKHLLLFLGAHLLLLHKLLLLLLVPHAIHIWLLLHHLLLLLVHTRIHARLLLHHLFLLLLLSCHFLLTSIVLLLWGRLSFGTDGPVINRWLLFLLNVVVGCSNLLFLGGRLLLNRLFSFLGGLLLGSIIRRLLFFRCGDFLLLLLFSVHL